MRYTLEKYKGLKTRFNCPRCNGKKTFARYIDIETNEYLGDHVGRCNKIDSCNYHYKPKDYFNDNKDIVNFWSSTRARAKDNQLKPEPKTIFTIPVSKFEETFIDFDNNNFALILAKLFGYEDAAKLLSLYNIGTSNKWLGANIFWQIDFNWIIRTGKIMLYNIETFKRVKEPYDHISWIHKGLIKETEEIKQCFFGEHLINQFFSKPIAIVESEKTAIICTHFMPDYIWLSAGNINGLSIDKFKVLQGRKVVLFPDLNKGYEIWEQKANEFKHIAEVDVSYYLQRIATPEQKAKGLDLADYLIESINVAHVGNVAQNKTLFLI